MSFTEKNSSAGKDSLEKKKYTIKDFELIKLIGSGGFGKVYLAKYKKDDLSIAVKICEKQKIIKKKMEQALFYEVYNHSQVDHPYICKLYQYFHDENRLYFVLEYAKEGTLFNVQKQQKHKRFSEYLAGKYVFQLANALNYCHDLGFFHGDLKPENVLVDIHGNAKLTDFGLSCPLSESAILNRGFYHGTLEYMAPEILAKQPYNEKIDHWSLGVMCYEFLVGRSPFYSRRKDLIIQKILDVKISFRKFICIGAQDLIINLLQKESKNRLSLNDVMIHKWISQPTEKIKDDRSFFKADLNS